MSLSGAPWPAVYGAVNLLLCGAHGLADELNKPCQTQKPLPRQVEVTRNCRRLGQCPPQGRTRVETIGMGLEARKGSPSN